MTYEVLRTLVAFLNTRGGTLLIGIDDAGNPIEDGEGRPVGIGVEIDPDVFSNEDAMIRRISDMGDARIGVTTMAGRVEIGPPVDYAGCKVLPVKCEEPSTEGEKFVYLREGTGGNSVPKAYVRSGSSTRELRIDEVHDYCDQNGFR